MPGLFFRRTNQRYDRYEEAGVARFIGGFKCALLAQIRRLTPRRDEAYLVYLVEWFDFYGNQEP